MDEPAVAWSGEAAAQDQAGRVRAAVAANLRRLRLGRGLSLRDLALITGLSKALLSQIEREVANPTVTVLGRVAEALEVTFSDLTRAALLAPEVVRGPGAGERASGARMLFSMMDRRRFDLSEGVLLPEQAGVPSDHGRGSTEYGYVVAGTVALTVGAGTSATTYRLGAGDAVRFDSEVRHVYAAVGGPATVLTVVAYGDD